MVKNLLQSAKTVKQLQPVRQFMIEQKLDALLISSSENIIYLTKYNNFSATEREAFLLITANKQYIFTDGRYKEAVLKLIPDFRLIESTQVTPFFKNLARIVLREKITHMGLETNNLTVDEYKRLKLLIKHGSSFTLEGIRAKKSQAEINALKKACSLADQAFTHLMPYIKEGISEEQLSFELEFYIRKSGANLSFKPIVAFGANSSIPHHNTSKTKLLQNQAVLLDFGVKYENYCSDMTRTVFYGKPDVQFSKLYQTVLKSQEAAIAYLQQQLKQKNFISASEVDKVARNFIQAKGYASIPHSLGHGIGIAVHESPALSSGSRSNLENGMVFSIEPGIYLPSFGGVRIEDLYLIQNNSLIQLTKSASNLIVL